jgi:hypothetical protein
LAFSRGGRAPILDDQGAEAPLAVGFTGWLASRFQEIVLEVAA